MAYQFDAPDATFELPKKLREISGLTRLDDQHLGAIQDEKGILFILDAETGEVVREHDFGDRGDYEGVELAHERVYVLDSDGDLFILKNWDEKKDKAKKIETPLSSRQDTEGLAFDTANNRLLILCKEDPGNDLEDLRAIYAYDLATETFIEAPVFTIHFDTLHDQIGEDNPINAALRRLAKPFADLRDFKPAALAVHPLTGELFAVSSVRKVLVILSPTGELTSAVDLPEELFLQPEGLAFLSNGDLFIANEGGGGRGTLHRFNARN